MCGLMQAFPTLPLPMPLRFLLALVLLAPAFAHAQPRLFAPVDGARTTLDARQAELLGHAEAGAAVEVQLAEVDFDALSAPVVSFNVADGTTVELVRDRSERQYAGVTHYFRSGDAETHAIVVEREGMVTATVRVEGQLYSVRPLTGGLHAVTRIDESRFVDHAPEWAEVEAAATEHDALHGMAAGPDVAAPQQSVPVVQDILVPYTANAASQVGDILALVQLAVSETNQGYAASDINLELNLVHTYQTPQNESSSFSTTLTRMQNKNDGYHDEIDGLRTQYGADMVGMIIGSGFYCGQARTIRAYNAGDAFQVTSQNCATGYYTFGHEFGHLQGARHNVEIDNSSFPYSFGHGKCYSPGNWRTVMSYGCPGFTNRVLRWSNPDVNYFGTPLGDTSLRDNARVLDLTANDIAGFYASSGSGTATVTGAVTSGSPVPSNGGRIFFDVTVENASGASFSGVYWVDAFLPDGSAYNRNPVVAARNVSLSDGQSSTFSFSGNVPRGGPAGIYTLRAYVGASYPSGIDDTGDFTFSKVGSRPAGGALVLAFEADAADGADAAAARVTLSGAEVGAYPNPFRASTTLRYAVAEAGEVSLAVYDVLGREVAVLAEGAVEAGVYEATFDASALPSGVYVWRLAAGAEVQTGRFLLAR